jgi:hypothetical protein
MIPGQYLFGKKISDEWLTSGTASRLFAFSVIVTLAATAVLLIFEVRDTSVLSRIFWGVCGVLFPLSIFFLWGGMWRYWMTGQPSSHVARRIWFIFLLFGMWYGAVLYYAFVYLPATRKHNEHLEDAAK